MTVSVVVPWRAGCPWREAAWEWVRARYEQEHPDWQVVAGHAPDGPWCKAAAVAGGLRDATGDVLVIADADVWCDGLDDAVHAVADGAPWAIPHRTVTRLTEQATGDVLAGATPDGRMEVEQRPYTGTMGGGITVLPRVLYEQIPLDPRFIEWGQEDEAWGVALTTLVGRPWRGTTGLYHLWHPPQRRQSRSSGHPAGVALARRYSAARRASATMEALIAEAK